MEIKNLHFSHKHTATAVLSGISFVAQKKKLTAILGPNGSGKTTLFKCISGVWRHQSGKILFEDVDISNWEHNKRAKIIAVVPQEHEPPFPYSVYDVVLMGRAVHVGMFSVPSKKDCKKAQEAIEIVAISHLKDKPYTKISGGERQLVLIARAIAQDTPIMLFDEPTSHLDFKNQVLVLRKIKEIINDRQITAIMTIHDPNLAMLFSDYIVMINGGSIIVDGNTKEVMNEHNLQRLYGVDVTVANANGVRIVVPKITQGDM